MNPTNPIMGPQNEFVEALVYDFRLYSPNGKQGFEDCKEVFIPSYQIIWNSIEGPSSSKHARDKYSTILPFTYPTKVPRGIAEKMQTIMDEKLESSLRQELPRSMLWFM